MDPLLNALSQQGLGPATSAVYNLLKGLDDRPVGRQELRELQSRINMYGVLMRAETVVNALAQNGFLSIQAGAARRGESPNISFKAPE
jgi:hypothetical protein